MIDLRRVIKRYNISQVQLGQEWGVNQSAVSQMLGRGKISLAKLEDLARICGCSVSELVSEEKNNTTVHICPKCGANLNINITISEQ